MTCWPGQIVAGSFVPTGDVYFTAGNVSTTIPLPSTGKALTALVTNLGAQTVYYTLGSSSVTTSPLTGNPLQPGQSVALPQGYNTSIALVTALGTSQVIVQSGTGCPLIAYTVAPPFIASDLINNGGVVNSNSALFPSSSANLGAGAFFSNSGQIETVPGSIPSVLAPAVFFANMTASVLILMTGANLPIVDPQVIGQLWLNSNVLNVSAGVPR